MTSTFSRGFRLKIIALCLNNPWFTQVGRSVITTDYFESEDEIDIVKAILEFFEAYGRVPSDPEDILQLCEGKHEETLFQIFDEKQGYDPSLVKDVVVQWAREQAAKIAILDSVDDVNRGDLGAVLTRIEEAVAVGQDLETQGLDVVGDLHTWLYDQWLGKVRTGWPHIDVHLEGGLGSGELGTILAPSNRGKSMALVNIAYGAAGLGSGKNVVIFTHEMADKIYAKRIAARMVFRFPSRAGDLRAYEDEFMELARNLMPGSIRVIHGTQMTIAQMDGAIERLAADGHPPHLIIDDYSDLLIPSRKHKERRFELSANFEGLRRLGSKWDVPVWTASQVGRKAYTKEIITEADVAEDIGKINISDVVIAICQTKDEADEDRCRLFLAKVRDGLRNMMYDAKFYPRQQAIITTNQTKRKDGIDA